MLLRISRPQFHSFLLPSGGGTFHSHNRRYRFMPAYIVLFKPFVNDLSDLKSG